MANYKGFQPPNQSRAGFGNPYEGTGFNNLDNFLNAGNVAWGAKQDAAPATMDLSIDRTQPKASFEQWMYGASSAPKENALKEKNMPGALDKGQPDKAPSAQPEMWTRDNSGWQFDRQKYEREFMKQKDTSPEALQRWIDEKKNQYFEEFQQGQHTDTAGGSWNGGVKAYPGTQTRIGDPNPFPVPSTQQNSWLQNVINRVIPSQQSAPVDKTTTTQNTGKPVGVTPTISPAPTVTPGDSSLGVQQTKKPWEELQGYVGW